MSTISASEPSLLNYMRCSCFFFFKFKSDLVCQKYIYYKVKVKNAVKNIFLYLEEIFTAHFLQPALQSASYLDTHYNKTAGILFLEFGIALKGLSQSALSPSIHRIICGNFNYMSVK